MFAGHDPTHHFSAGKIYHGDYDGDETYDSESWSYDFQYPGNASTYDIKQQCSCLGRAPFVQRWSQCEKRQPRVEGSVSIP